MAEIEMGNLYNVNKLLMAKAPGVSEKKIKEELTSIGLWMSSKPKTYYYTLMCRELYDFTVFHFNSPNYNQCVEELHSVLKSRGKVIAIDYAHGFDSYECWIKTEDGEVVMYLLFAYDQGVIEIGK